ncbi:MAG: hypothetical protein V7607_2612 [Solirubrobacteraceae bacterium]
MDIPISWLADGVLRSSKAKLFGMHSSIANLDGSSW